MKMRPQQLYLWKVCALLLIQCVLLLSVVAFVQTYMPTRTCLFTCSGLIDLFLYLGLVLLVIYNLRIGRSRPVRYTAFFVLTILMAYLIGLQYNIQKRLNGAKTAENFARAIIMVVMLFILNLIMLPFVMKHMGTVGVLSVSLFWCLIGLIWWGFFVGRAYIIWVAVGLFVFVGLLITDTARLVSACKDYNKCDPLDGASVLYLDLVNILQQLFILMNDHR